MHQLLTFKQVTVPEGRNRDRKNDLLVIRDKGTSFKIIHSVSFSGGFFLSFYFNIRVVIQADAFPFRILQSERDDPTTVIEKEEWNETRQDMERHLRKLRDFSVSNWFQSILHVLQILQITLTEENSICDAECLQHVIPFSSLCVVTIKSICLQRSRSISFFQRLLPRTFVKNFIIFSCVSLCSYPEESRGWLCRWQALQNSSVGSFSNCR